MTYAAAPVTLLAFNALYSKDAIAAAILAAAQSAGAADVAAAVTAALLAFGRTRTGARPAAARAAVIFASDSTQAASAAAASSTHAAIVAVGEARHNETVGSLFVTPLGFAEAAVTSIIGRIGAGCSHPWTTSAVTLLATILPPATLPSSTAIPAIANGNGNAGPLSGSTSTTSAAEGFLNMLPVFLGT